MHPILYACQSGSCIVRDLFSRRSMRLVARYATRQVFSTIAFRCSRLPLSDRSADVILCHMAFMLMAPLEPVISEIARVLKNGGRFAAITGNASVKPGRYADIQSLLTGFIAQRYPKMREARLGDKRVHSRDGLWELFRPELGFSRLLDFGEFELQAVVDADGL